MRDNNGRFVKGFKMPKEWIEKRNFIGKNNPNYKYDKSNPPLCKCGCGQPTNFNYILKRFCDYITGHNSKGNTNSNWKGGISKIKKEKSDRLWKDNELKVLIENYKQLGNIEISKMVDRTSMSIKRKLNSLGLLRGDNSRLIRSRLHFGEKNPAWLGGKSFEPYGLDFNDKLKREIRKRDIEICQECGKNQNNFKRKLDIHHIDYNKKNNLPINLISLCYKCHLSTNLNREHWKQHFQMKMFIKEIFNPENILVWNENHQLIGMEGLK